MIEDLYRVRYDIIFLAGFPAIGLHPEGWVELHTAP